MVVRVAAHGNVSPQAPGANARYEIEQDGPPTRTCMRLTARGLYQPRVFSREERAIGSGLGGAIDPLVRPARQSQRNVGAVHSANGGTTTNVAPHSAEWSGSRSLARRSRRSCSRLE